MFTGIVTAIGHVTACQPSPLNASATPNSGGMRIHIEANDLDLSHLEIGESIAVQGCCLTVIHFDGHTLAFDLSAETLRCTTGLNQPGPVNLERALRVGDRLGGHFVSGHVDGIGRITQRQMVGESWLLETQVPPDLAPYLAPKGSITIDGVSLTVNTVQDATCQVNLIPHTLAVTTLKRLQIGSLVNVEVDLLARYTGRLLETIAHR